METRANYVALGLFTLVALAASFIGVYWWDKLGNSDNMVPLNVRIQGSVSGLSKGSSVQFNGIDVGRVQSLDLDPNDPRFVIVGTSVSASTPVRQDTRASIGVKGLSGGAFIQLEGGSPEAIALLSPNAMGTTAPRIDGDPAALGDLLARVNSIAARTERMMGTIEQFVEANNTSLSATISNAEQFSKALADNSEGVGRFLESAGEVANSLENLSEKLDGSVTQAEAILKAVEPDAVRNTLNNAEAFSKTLADQREEIASLVKSVNDAAGRLNGFTARLDGTLSKVDAVVGAIEPEQVRSAIASISNSSAKAETLLAGIEGAAVGKAIDDISKVAANARGLIEAIDQTTVKKTVDDLSEAVGKARTVIDAVEPERVRTAIASISNSATKAEALLAGVEANAVGKAVDDISVAAAGARTLIEEVDPTTVKQAVDDLSATVASARAVISGLDPATVQKTVTDLSASASSAREILASVTPQKVGQAVDDISSAAATTKALLSGIDENVLRNLMNDLGNASQNVSKLVSAIDATKVNAAVVDITEAAKGAQTIVADVSKVTSQFGTRGPEINQMITDASELTGRLNQASKRVDGILEQIDILVGSDVTSGLAADIRDTLKSFRETSQNLSVRVSEVARSITKFTGRGLEGTQGLIRDARQSLNRIDRVIRNIESNPSSLLSGSGGSRVRESSGSRQRR